MEVRVLGTLTIDDGRTAPAPRDRLVLAALVTRLGRPVSVESLASALWGQALPSSWSKVIPGCIMRLRRRLVPATIETTPLGYRLVANGVDIDTVEFERLVARGSELLELREPDRAAHAFSEALELWRGQPLAELADWEPARIEAFRLDEIHLAAEESLLEARLQSGDLRDAAAQARARVAEAPLRERRWVILGLSQYRQGRQGDALATVRRGRELLAAELGLDPCAELAELEQAILHQNPELQSATAFHPASAECPYFGLPPASANEGERYFGRETELERGVQELERHGVLVVSGSSGVGKSSFVRAGIAAHFGDRGRSVTVFTPGESPVLALRASVEHDAESLLIVDQCEQAFANNDPEETRKFFEEVREMVFRGTVVMVIRADRLGDLAEHHGFSGLIESNLLMLGPLSEQGLRAVIEKPAAQAGLILEPGLVEILIRDADGRNLPLLSHALRQIWQRREGRVLSVDGYRASGEIDGAVAQTAEEVFAELSDEGGRQARDILLRLVEPSNGGGVICQRVNRTSVAIDDAHARVADRLVDARLVTSDQESFQLAHEAVAREWPRLREWLADDVEGQRILRHLNAAAIAWDAMERPDSELYRGARLSAATHWRESASPVLAPVEQAFLDASVEREAAVVDETRRQLAHERRSVRRLRWLAGATALLAVLALAAGSVAAVQVAALNERALIDDARRVSALAEADPVYERALLTAMEAIGLRDDLETRRTLLDVMGRSPRIVSVTRTIDGEGIQQMSLEPQGSAAVLVDDSQGARVLDLHRRAELSAYMFESKIILDAAQAIDDRIVVSMLEDGCDRENFCGGPAVRSFGLDGASGGEIAFTGFGLPAIDIEFSSDGALAAAVAPLPWYSDGNNIAIWRVDAPDQPVLLKVPDPGTNPGAPNWANAFGRVRFSSDGSLLYASGFGPTVIFDTRSGALVGQIEGEGLLAVSPEGDQLLIRHGRTAARIVDLDDPGESLVLSMPDVVIDGAFNPDGNRVVTTSGDRIWIWKVNSGQLEESLEGHMGQVKSVAFRSADELVSAGDDGALITWAMGNWSADFHDWRRDGSEFVMPHDDRTLISNLPSGSFVGIAADPDIWLDRACTVAGRSLSEEEWQTLFSERPYDPVCQSGSFAASP